MKDRPEAPCATNILFPAALAVLIRLQDFFVHFHDWDEAAMMAQAWAVTQGQILYVDIFQIHPALNIFFFVPFFLIFNPDTAPHLIKITNCLLIIGGAVLVYMCARARTKNQHTGMIASTAFVLCFAANWAKSSHGEFYAAFPLLGAAYLLLFKKNPIYRDYFSAGICLAVACFFKQTAVFDSAALLAGALLLRSDSGQTTRQMRAAFAGALTIFTAVSMYFLYAGAWTQAMTSMWITPLTGYSGLAEAPGLYSFFTQRAHTLSAVVRSVAAELPVLTLAAASGAAITLRAKKPRVLTEPERVCAACLLWLITDLVGIALIGRFYPHYLIQIIAPLILLSVFALRMIPEGKLEILFKTFALLTFSLALRSASSAISELAARNWAPKRVVQSQKTAEIIRKVTKPTDRIFLYRAWNLDVFFLSRRLSNNGIYMFIDMISEHSKNREIEAAKRKEFTDNLPRVIAVDPTGWLFPKADAFFRDILRRHYDLLTSETGINIYLKRTPRDHDD